jgi:hypothetical protein
MERQRLLTRSPMYGERRSPISTFEASTAEAAKRSSEDELFEVRMGSMCLCVGLRAGALRNAIAGISLTHECVVRLCALLHRNASCFSARKVC